MKTKNWFATMVALVAMVFVLVGCCHTPCHKVSGAVAQPHFQPPPIPASAPVVPATTTTTVTNASASTSTTVVSPVATSAPASEATAISSGIGSYSVKFFNLTGRKVVLSINHQNHVDIPEGADVTVTNILADNRFIAYHVKMTNGVATGEIPLRTDMRFYNVEIHPPPSR